MTEDKASYKIDTKFNYEDGVLEINIPEILAQLDQEDLESIAQLHAFESAIWNEIKRGLRDEFTTQNYNSNIHRLRIELLSGDGADRVLKNTVAGILRDQTSAEHYMKHYRDAYWKLRNWCWDRENLTPDQRNAMPDEAKKHEHPPRVKDADVEKAIAKAKGK